MKRYTLHMGDNPRMVDDPDGKYALAEDVDCAIRTTERRSGETLKLERAEVTRLRAELANAHQISGQRFEKIQALLKEVYELRLAAEK